MSSRRKFILTFVLLIAIAINLRAQSILAMPDQPDRLIISSPFVVNPFPVFPMFGLPGDSLYKYQNLLKSGIDKTQQTVKIDNEWQYISIIETVNGQQLKVPFTAPVDWFLNKKIYLNSKSYFFEKLPLSKSVGTPNRISRSKSLELVGVNLGDFGRASLRVNGNVNITGNVIYQDQDLAVLNNAESQKTKFDIDQKQHLNIEGTIGDRITISLDQDSERDFDWENNIKISYKGKEDDILQTVEAGNTSLSLPATQFVTFTGNSQGLFGVKALAKLGPVDITTIAAIEQTKKASQSYTGSGQAQTQVIRDYEYVKNQYFFVHEWYRNGVSTIIDGKQIELLPYFPLNDEGRHYLSDYQLVEFELYQLDQSNNPAADVGIAYIDPSQPEQYETYNKEGTFVKLERDIDYYLNVDLGYIRLRSRSQNQILAAHYKLIDKRSAEIVHSVGHGLLQGDTTLVLKMLKPQSPHPNHPTWDLMFKNVYYLGTTNIDYSGFAVRILNNNITPVSDRDADGTYLSQFGIDNWNENGARIPDDKIDMDNIVFLNYGELHLPYLLPFVSDKVIEGGNTSAILDDKLGSGEMYTSTVSTDYVSDSRFIIEADYTNQSSTINLGFMIVEGSETVKIDGEVQTKNQDYIIDYYTGTVNIIKADINPNADVRVDYEKNELVSFDKKVILGSRAQMDIGENAFIGATALYYNQSVIDEKVEVGYEPTRNFIWNVNGKYNRDLDQLTYYLNDLPLIETNERSTISLEGEYAQVYPNPNPVSNKATGDANGVAYIDDFEGAKRSDTPRLTMYNWLESSAPINLETGLSFSQRNRANLVWYNPYIDYPTKSIWPQQSTSTQSGNTTVDILILEFDKYAYQNSTAKDSIWAGLITTLHSGAYDQTQSKFFEIWLFGNQGKLTVDLGKISEDWNGDGLLNTEDVPVAGLAQGNGILDNGEDIGLDGARDEYEDGWGGALDSTLGITYQDYLSNGETVLINPFADINDPNGDNWEYDEDKDYNDFSKANGTQGNRNSIGGTYPNSEDLDGSGFLDKNNNYFTKTFTLDRSNYFVDETKQDDGTPTGWQLYRIPLSHFEKVNDVDWSEIRNIRLTWSGADSGDEIGIAKIELVGNDWKELGTSLIEENEYDNTDSTFAITVINTEENPEYTPPEGVKGEYNPVYDIRSKEQSLVLQFDNLSAHHKGAAQKTLSTMSGNRAQSYLLYKELKMFVYGEESAWIGIDKSEVNLFLQFGLGDQYYEVIQPVYSGWDEEENRNAIKLDLDWLTKLKVQDQSTVTKFNETDIFVDSTDFKQYLFTNENGELTGKKVTIVGQPSLSRIQQFTVGIINNNDEPISGQVWIDELRLSKVKKEKGTAMRIQSSLQLADIGKASIIYNKKDADFHVLQERLGSNETKEDIRINTNLQMNKFLPKAWSLAIPVNLSFTNTTNVPKFYPGTDIRVSESSVPDSIVTKSQSVNYSVSFSKTTNSDNKWIRYTIDNITGNFSTTKSISSNAIMKEVLNESYKGKLNYIHSFGRDNFIKPLKWLNGIPVIGQKLSQTNVYYSPTTINAAINFNEKLTQKNSRVSGRSPDEYNLGLIRNFSLDYKLTDNIQLKYNSSSQSDLDSYRAKIIRAIQEFDPGIVTNTSENLNTTFNPVFAKWLKPNFNYSATYNWSKPLTSSIEGANINSTLRFSSAVTLNLSLILDGIAKTNKKKSVSMSSPRRRRTTTEPEKENIEVNSIEEKETSLKNETDTDRDTRSRKQKKLEKIGESEDEIKKISTYERLQLIVKKIKPIVFSYNTNLNRTGYGVIGDVPTGYKFGWQAEHGLEQSKDVGSSLGQWNYVRNMSIRSGLEITKNTLINLNYVQELGVNRTIGTDLELHSSSRDYIAFGEKLENGMPFTSWSLRITGLEKWPLLKNFTKSASLEHAFTGKEVSSWKIEGITNIPMTGFFSVSDFGDTYADYLLSSKVTSNYSPLIGLTMALPRGITINLRHNLSKSAGRSPTGLTVQKDRSVNFSSNYSLKGGFTIPLPFMEDYRIDNTMNFILNADYNLSNVMASKDDVTLTTIAENESWKAGLRISYSFSTRLTGAVIFEYRESDSKNIGKKIDRDIGFDLNFAISG